jgi:hypothetical protein
MHLQEEMRAHRVGTAGTLALTVVQIGAIMVAVMLSGADSSASVACHVTHPNGSTAPGGAAGRYAPRQAGAVDGIAARRNTRDNHDSSTAARDDVREDLPGWLAEHQVRVVGIAIGSGEAQDQGQTA